MTTSNKWIVAVFLIAASFSAQRTGVAAEYYGDAGSSAGDAYSSPAEEQFAPESYNPYLPQGTYSQQQQFYAPAPVISQPLYPQPSVSQPIYPQMPRVAPATPIQSPVIAAPPVGTYYMPPVNPGLNFYSPGLYSPGLYNPGTSVFPGYFNPFNNSQGGFPAF